MPKSVNVVLNSNNAIAGNTSQSTYFVDWNAILDRKKSYYLHFVYIGEVNHYDGSNLATVYATFNTENYQPTFNGTINTQMLGFLMPTLLQGGSNSFLQSLDNTNLPIYMETPPNNNTFNISILNNNNPPTPWVDSSGAPAPPGAYILVLRFTEVEDYDI